MQSYYDMTDCIPYAIYYILIAYLFYTWKCVPLILFTFPIHLPNPFPLPNISSFYLGDCVHGFWWGFFFVCLFVLLFSFSSLILVILRNRELKIYKELRLYLQSFVTTLYDMLGGRLALRNMQMGKLFNISKPA